MACLSLDAKCHSHLHGELALRTLTAREAEETQRRDETLTCRKLRQDSEAHSRQYRRSQAIALRATTASPNPSFGAPWKVGFSAPRGVGFRAPWGVGFRAPWRMGDAVVSKGNAEWTMPKEWTSLSGSKLLTIAPLGKDRRGSLLNCPWCPHHDQIAKGTKLNWTELMLICPLLSRFLIRLHVVSTKLRYKLRGDIRNICCYTKQTSPTPRDIAVLVLRTYVHE